MVAFGPFVSVRQSRAGGDGGAGQRGGGGRGVAGRLGDSARRVAGGFQVDAHADWEFVLSCLFVVSR